MNSIVFEVMRVGSGAVERVRGAEVRQRDAEFEREKESMCVKRSTITHI